MEPTLATIAERIYEKRKRLGILVTEANYHEAFKKHVGGERV